MRLRRIVPLLVLVAAGAAVPNAAHARYEGDLNFFVGQKWVKTSDWKPVDEQPELGVKFAFGQERAPIYFAVDVLASQTKDTVQTELYGPVSVRGATREYAVGVRKVWNVGATHPILEAGCCLVVASLDYDSATYSPRYGDQDYGVWIESGVTWRIGAHLNLGFDLRYTEANGNFSAGTMPVKVSIGGFHAGMLIGYGW